MGDFERRSKMTIDLIVRQTTMSREAVNLHLGSQWGILDLQLQKIMTRIMLLFEFHFNKGSLGCGKRE
jgi:hypothetical protein